MHWLPNSFLNCLCSSNKSSLILFPLQSSVSTPQVCTCNYFWMIFLLEVAPNIYSTQVWIIWRGVMCGLSKWSSICQAMTTKQGKNKREEVQFRSYPRNTWGMTGRECCSAVLGERLHPRDQQPVLAQPRGRISWLHRTFTNVLIRWFLHSTVTLSL